uniref:Flavodoxin-like domain-containing protein n=1 Tax=Calcidiscus leptoporus TaxID=127549 RepID=A0A7S0IWG7_9EUKA|mmetsp:Transcript_25608/g.59721  ORF Transcript_25608/g.59721 Transcript_25608/m.59721 type:complete len:266 (+) Transcript_25608:28-825(+)
MSGMEEKSGESPSRALLIYGSETGNAHRGLIKCSEYWRAHSDGSYVIADVLSGNEVLDSLEELAQKYDVLLIATSSFGEGDPPYNFVQFLIKLVRAKEEGVGASPLQGMQHSVLGYGQSVYPTFQNTPRYVDKILGDLGSRRFAKRVELDEGQDESASGAEVEPESFGSGGGIRDGVAARAHVGRDAGVGEWREAVCAALKLARKSAMLPPVCAWHEPGDGNLLEKSVTELVGVRPERIADASQPYLMLALLVALVAGAYFVYLS